MKQIKILLLILFLTIPSQAFAFTGNVEINCDKAGMSVNEATHCTILGHAADGIVTGFEAVLTFSNDLEVTNFALTNNFLSDGNDDVTSGYEISAPANDLSGDFDIATFDLTLAEGATSSSQEVSLSSIVYYYDLVTTYEINNPVTVEFADFINMNDYQIDNVKNIIYGLSPSTVGVFKNSISTNATLKVFNGSNVEQDNNAALATGHLFKVSFPSHNIDYKISILGDVLGNGTVTVDDAKRIALHIIDGNVINGDEYLMAADFDGNNVIKMNDAIRLLKSIQN